MRAIIVKQPGGVDQLAFGEWPRPEPKAQELLVKIHAFSVNHMDLLQREGKYPPPHDAPPILGVDFSGVVEEVGPHTRKFKKGDRVMGLVSGGAYAEYVAINEELALPIPENLSFEEAAAIPETFITAYQALFLIGEIQPNQWILVHSGAGGVGTAAIQLIREIGAKSLVTASSLEKIEACLELGASAGFNHQSGPFASKVLDVTEGHGVDLIIDFMGPSFIDQNVSCLSSGGCIIFLSMLSGKTIKNLDLSLLFSKWATLTATTLRSRSFQYRARLIEEFSRFALKRFRHKALIAKVFEKFPWEKIKEAHQLLESKNVIGKIIITID
jgi:tumor protein p53-inducible protein 3